LLLLFHPLKVRCCYKLIDMDTLISLNYVFLPSFRDTTPEATYKVCFLLARVSFTFSFTVAHSY
jgi:hypothetical protein